MYSMVSNYKVRGEQMKIEKIVFGGYIFCLLSLVFLFIWADKQFEQIEEYKQNKCKPRIEKIVEQKVDIVIEEEIEKEPPDVIEEMEEDIIEEVEDVIIPSMILNADIGKVQGPQEIEKYYNLPMDRVIQTMRNKGYSELEYPYCIREDGVKMLGDFVIVAANEYPRGTVVQTSLGQGIVCDTHESNEEFIDIAVEW